MTRLPLPIAPALLLAAAACAAQPERPQTGDKVAADGPCEAAAGQKFIGAASDQASLDAIRIATGARTVRQITPGMIVTMEYRADRVNVEIDEAARVTAVRCG